MDIFCSDGTQPHLPDRFYEHRLKLSQDLRWSSAREFSGIVNHMHLVVISKLLRDLCTGLRALVKVPAKHHVTLERMGLVDLIGASRIFDSRHACVVAYKSQRS